MSEEVHTHYIKQGFATSDDVVLSTSPTTRIVFRPAVHGSGVRGLLIRQKIGVNKEWADVNDVDFRKLPADSGIQLELDTSATDTLYRKLGQLYEVQGQGVEYGDQKYVVAKEDEVLLFDDKSKRRAIQQLVSEGHSKEFWKLLLEKDPDLGTRLAAGKIQMDRRQAILEFTASLTTQTDSESYWEGLFQAHPWMLQGAFAAAVFMLAGETYVGGKLPVGRQGKGGVATDFLFSDESTKSFAVVEIKTPKTNLVGSIYRGEAGTSLDNESYSMSPELSGSVVQTRNQIAVAIEHFESVLGKGFEKKLNRVHPKGVLVIGSAKELSERQMASFNHFRQGLFSLTIITFDELLHRLSIMYEIDLETTSTKGRGPIEA